MLLSFTGKCVIFINKLRKGKEKQCKQASDQRTLAETLRMRGSVGSVYTRDVCEEGGGSYEFMSGY